MALKYGFNFFLKELVLFASTLAGGIWVAYRLQAHPMVGLVPSVSFTLHDLVVLVLIMVLLSLLLGHFPKMAGGIFKVFLVLVILAGAQIFFATFLVAPFDFGLAVLMVVILSLLPKVGIHDLAVIMAIAGMAVVIGTSITPLAGVVVLCLLSIYDIVAVYKTKHMVRMAQGMIQSKSIFGFIIPMKWSGFLASRDKAAIGRDFMILGSGDIAVPLIFAVSLVTTSLKSAIFVGVFSMLGLFLSHLIFTNQKNRQPMAALPPIATVAVLGYLLSLFIV